MIVSRRSALALGAAFAVAPHAARAATDVAQELARLETRSGGRLGVCILDTGTGRNVGHRQDERFAMCSTFKLPLAAAILQRVDRGEFALDTFIPYTKADLVMHAPVTEPNLAKGGMTLGALAEAAQKQSDNVAANLLLKQIDGPAGFTWFCRAFGDETTRLDRIEPEMNEVREGDERDTTTPIAMAATLANILTGNVLKPASRARLIQWMVDTESGAKRLRAGLPQRWRAGDKTGTMLWSYDTKLNDVAIVWPPGKPPLIVTAYLNTAPASEISDRDQAVLAEVGRITAAASQPQ